MKLAAAVLLLAARVPADAAQSVPGDDAIRRELGSILGSADYDTGEGGPPELNLIERLWMMFVDWLGGAGNLWATPWLAWTTIVVLLLVLLAIFAHAGWITMRALRAAREESVGPSPAAGGRREDPRELLERARAAAGRGDGIESLRLIHRAVLIALDRRGLVRFQESLTPGDTLRQLRPHPRERGDFEALARIYEPAFFGRMAPRPGEVDEGFRLAAALAAEARR